MKFFLKLIGRYNKKIKEPDEKPPPEKIEDTHRDISNSVDEFIQIENYQRVEELVRSGYKLSDNNVGHFFHNMISMTMYDKSLPLFLIENVAVNYSERFSRVISRNVEQNHRTDFWCYLVKNTNIENAINNEAMILLMKFAKAKKAMGNYYQLQDVMNKRTSTRHQEMLHKLRRSESVTKVVIGQKLAQSLKDIPAPVSGLIDNIQENLTKINVESLSATDRADLKEIVDTTLPDLIMKYAAIDKTMMTYKNSQNESIETLLQYSLFHIEQKINSYRQATEDAKIKDFKIAVKMSK